MTHIKAGDIILIPFPFTDMSGAKKRPALVLASVEKNLIVVMLTSQIRKRKHEIPITNWQKAGLIRETVIRVDRIYTIDFSLVNQKVGSLEKEDFKNVKKAVVKIIARGE